MTKKFIIFTIPILFLIAGGIFCWWQNNQKEIGSEAQARVAGEDHQTVVVLGDGAKITVPSGSALEGTTITARLLDPDTIPNLPEWSKQAFLLYEFSVDKPLQGPVTIQISLPKNDELSLLGHYHNESWEVIPFMTEKDMAIIKIDNLSLFGWLEADGQWFISFFEQVGPPSERALEMTFGNVLKVKKWTEGKIEESVYWLFGDKAGKFYYKISVVIKLTRAIGGDPLAYAELSESGELDRMRESLMSSEDSHYETRFFEWLMEDREEKALVKKESFKEIVIDIVPLSGLKDNPGLLKQIQWKIFLSYFDDVWNFELEDGDFVPLQNGLLTHKNLDCQARLRYTPDLTGHGLNYCFYEGNTLQINNQKFERAIRKCWEINQNFKKIIKMQEGMFKEEEWQKDFTDITYELVSEELEKRNIPKQYGYNLFVVTSNQDDHKQCINDFEEVLKTFKLRQPSEQGQEKARAEVLEKITVNASSFLIDKKGVYDYSPSMVLDGNWKTGWVESKENDGIGESLTFHFPQAQAISGFKIVPGYAENEEVYFWNNRVKEITIEFDDGSKFDRILNDYFGEQEISFPNITTKKVKLIIKNIYFGSKYKDTAISEINF